MQPRDIEVIWTRYRVTLTCELDERPDVADVSAWAVRIVGTRVPLPVEVDAAGTADATYHDDTRVFDLTMQRAPIGDASSNVEGRQVVTGLSA